MYFIQLYKSTYLVSADHLISCIDTSLDPCENFYEFSCARWKRENEIPNYYGEYGINAKVEETVAEQLKGYWL